MTQESVTTVKPPGDPAYEWWRDNCRSDARGPAIRAQLRRCRSNTEAAAIPAAVALARRVGALRLDDRPFDPRIDTALGLARVLAHINENASDRPMRAAGWKSFPKEGGKGTSGDDQPRLAEARFRRLLEVESGEKQVAAFVRLVALLGGSVNVSALSRDFMRWEHDDTRRRWAFDYYAASVAAPPSDDISPSEDDA